MQRNFRVGDRVRLTNPVEEGMTATLTGIVPENSLFAGFWDVDLDDGDGGICSEDEMELLLPIKLSEVSGKVDDVIWLNKVIQSDEAFKSKPGYALAAVVKVLLAKGVLTPSDFDLLKTEESAITTVPANKD